MFSEPAHNLLPDSPAPPARLAAYAATKSEALGLLDRLARLHPPVAAPCRALATKLAAERFDLAVVGEFKRGKSCLVNALLGENLLPTGVLPLTSVPVEIGHGGTLAIEVRFDDGERLAIGRDQLADYATEAGNPGNAKGVAAILIAFPAPLLERGLRLVDTPGVGSAHRHNTLTPHAALPRYDAALFVLAADQPVCQAELDFLETVGVHAQRIFFALNKIDRLEDGDIGPVAEFARAVPGAPTATKATAYKPPPGTSPPKRYAAASAAPTANKGIQAEPRPRPRPVTRLPTGPSAEAAATRLTWAEPRATRCSTSATSSRTRARPTATAPQAPARSNTGTAPDRPRNQSTA